MKSKSKIIGIIGSRSRNSLHDLELIESKFFKIYKENDIICSGGCSKGGDRFALMIHKKYFIPYLEFPANWNKHGKSAGFIRNGSIAEWSDWLIACVADDRRGGTEDTIKKFLKSKPKSRLIII